MLFLGTLAKLRKATVRFVMSVCLSACLSPWDDSAPTGRVFMKFYIEIFFENPSRKFEFHENLTRITGTLHGAQCTLLTIFRSIPVRKINVSRKIGTENQNTQFTINNFFSYRITEANKMHYFSTLF